MAGARTWHLLIGALWKVIIKNLSNGKQQSAPPTDKALESGIREPSVLRFINSVSNLLTQDLVLSEHCKAFLWIPYITVFANRSTKVIKEFYSIFKSSQGFTIALPG